MRTKEAFQTDWLLSILAWHRNLTDAFLAQMKLEASRK